MNCAKMAERSRCSLGYWDGWVQGTCIRWGVDAPMGRDTFGVSGQLKSIVKYRILGIG